MVDVLSRQKFSEDLANYIISRVTGVHPEDEIISEKPSRQFLIGTLAARKLEKNKELKEDVETYDESKAASIRASKLRLSIRTKKSEIEQKPEVNIKAIGNIYYQIKAKNTIQEPESTNGENVDELKKSNIFWKRLQFSDERKLEISPNSEFELDFSKVISEANADPLNEKKITKDAWTAKIYVSVKDFEGDTSLLSFNYENSHRENKDKKDEVDHTLFDCRLEIDVSNLSVKEFCDEYKYNGYKQKYYYDFRTLNCQATWLDKDRTKLATSHFGVFEQENIRPREKSVNVNLTFSNLMSPAGMIFSLEGLVRDMKKYLEIYVAGVPAEVNDTEFQPRDGNRETTWGERRALINNFKELITRVETGLELIKSNSGTEKSFLKTNETFYNYYLNQNKTNAGWRLFQLVFFLSSLESIVEKKKLDVVDVLHVDTGGGKSEAYFAVALFASFYERYSGKQEGVSAIVKFPLRMLSIQQLERLSGIIIHAEAVRKKYTDIFPGESFSLGYYVGNDDTFPDLYVKSKNMLYNNSNLISPAPISKIISTCPLCPQNAKGSIRLIDDPKGKRIVHKCDKCGNQSHIYFSDREIFRWRPTILVSTVDKWAGLAQQRRVRSLLGGNGSVCPDGHGFISSGDKCEDKADEEFTCDNIGEKSKNVGGPILSIQDEMHLLREGFGTISAHFEGLTEAIIETNSNHKIKHITMSATLNGTGNQIDQLYKKNYFVIPGRCPEGVGSENDFFFETHKGPKRIIYGIKPNLRDNHYASLRTLLHFSEFMVISQKALNLDPSSFCSKYLIRTESEAQELVKEYLVPLTYHIKKQDAYDMARFKEAVIGGRLKKKFNGSDLLGRVLTGDSNLDELKETIDNVKCFVRNYDPLSSDKDGLKLEPIYATSVVSHGVDLDELNFMIFQGLPYATSEYIQALSRIGRKTLGIVFLWFYPNRVRDDSFYRNFVRYHYSLDHEVKPIPIKRSSRLGLQQTINAMFCAAILNHLSNKKDKPIYLKNDIRALTANDKEEICDFIKKAYGATGALDIDIPKEVEDRLSQIINSDTKNEFFPNTLARSGNPFFRNPSGMRGIQKQLMLELNPGEDRLLTQNEVTR